MRILKFGALYFALVFAAGFVLGALRVLVIAPRLGSRIAELLESPVMLLVTIFAARWVMHRVPPPRPPVMRLAVGAFALSLLLLAEFGVALRLRGLTIEDYFASFDPVSGTVYFLLLGLFALMPLLVSRR